MVSVRRHARDWRAYLARGGVILGSLYLLLYRSRKRAPAKIYEGYEYASARAHQTAEEYSWRSSRNIGVATLIFSIVAAVSTAGAFWETRRQAIAADSALTEARDEQRPWVTAPTKIEDNALVISNVGKTPTIGLYLDVEVLPKGVKANDASDSFCAKIEPILKNNRFALLPGADWKVAISDLKASDDFALLKNGEKRRTLIGCTVYRDRLDKLIHKTGFMTDVIMKDGMPTLARVYTATAD